MKRKAWLGSLFVPLVLVVGCAGSTATSPPATRAPAQASTNESAQVERARKALLPLKKGLKKELSAAMAQGGPVAAINVCRERAAAITKSISDDDPNVALGRTSAKLRNVENKPAPWLQPILTHFEGSKPEPGQYKLVDLPEGKVGYAEPIYVGGVCLKCHGKTLEPAIGELLKKHYPLDQAQGYDQGQFRGLFWVTMPR